MVGLRERERSISVTLPFRNTIASVFPQPPFENIVGLLSWAGSAPHRFLHSAPQPSVAGSAVVLPDLGSHGFVVQIQRNYSRNYKQGHH